MARERKCRKQIYSYSTYVFDGSQTIDRRIDSSRRINKPVVQDIVSSSESYNRPRKLKVRENDPSPPGLLFANGVFRLGLFFCLGLRVCCFGPPRTRGGKKGLYAAIRAPTERVTARAHSLYVGPATPSRPTGVPQMP